MCINTAALFENIAVSRNVCLFTSPSPHQGKFPVRIQFFRVNCKILSTEFVISWSLNVIDASTLFHFVVDRKTHNVLLLHFEFA